MSEEFGNDFISIADDEGNEFELEVIDRLEYQSVTYLALLAAAEDEDAHSEDDDGLIILKVLYEDGEEVFATPDTDEELTLVYDMFMERLFDDNLSEEETIDEKV